MLLKAALSAAAGRTTTTPAIDMAVGVVMLCRTGGHEGELKPTGLKRG
ncbi:MAG: hypothetical protein HQK99_07355 [Nitrospirae bacterium]|nr:hypothetical protein [Nitrospirota bacterium]